MNRILKLLPESESCDEASDEESDEENASNLLVETTPLPSLIWQNGVQAESLRPLNLWVIVQYCKEVKGRVAHEPRRPTRPGLIPVSEA